VVRKNLAVEKGEQRLFDDYRYFLYLTALSEFFYTQFTSPTTRRHRLWIFRGTALSSAAA
jgi:hypothetical protein